MDKELLEFIDQSPSPYQAVDVIEEELKAKGYREQKLEDAFDLEKEGSYYVKREGALVAFDLGKKAPWEGGFRLVTSHLDSPCFRIKPSPHKEDGAYIAINTEVYGGPLYYTWFDRPLKLAGQVFYEEGGKVACKKVDIDRPLTIIPSLAIHMNREANKNFAPNPQQDLLPIFAKINEDLKDPLYQALKEDYGLDQEKILDFDLFLVPYEKGEKIGLDEELISVARLDNLASAHASLLGLLTGDKADGTKVSCFLNHEEIGSRSEEGAQGRLVYEILHRMVLALGGNEDRFYQALHKSFLLSADLAHAVHPHHKEVADPTNQPKLGKGPVIKIAANKSYLSSGSTGAYIEELCRKNHIPHQKFVNASDRRGGSTLGPLLQESLGVPGADIGTPILSMHSARELGATRDQEAYIALFKAFFAG